MYVHFGFLSKQYNVSFFWYLLYKINTNWPNKGEVNLMCYDEGKKEVLLFYTL